MNKNKIIIGGILAVILIGLIILFGYTQFLEKSTIQVALQHQVDLSNPPGSVFAIVTKPQKLKRGVEFEQGTRFIGKVEKEDKNFVIYFDSLQRLSGKKERFNGKVTFVPKEVKPGGGISSRLGETIQERTKTSVLGAIFSVPQSVQAEDGAILPRGTTLFIEVQ